MTSHPQKITFGEMREMGARDVLIYCRDHRCIHVETNADGWGDDVRLPLNSLKQKNHHNCWVLGIFDQPFSPVNTMDNGRNRPLRRRRITYLGLFGIPQELEDAIRRHSANDRYCSAIL
jgi:hypothetical protein